MKYLFRRLETLCCRLPDVSRNEPQLNKLALAVKAEITGLKAQLKEVYFEPHSDLAFESMTNAYQKSLIELLNQISAYGAVSNGERLQTEIYNSVESLLRFLHHYFDKYIDKRQVVPEPFRQTCLLEVDTLQAGIELQIGSRVEESLKTLLLKPFRDFKNFPQQATLHNLFFCRLLSRELTKQVEKNSGFDEIHIIKILLYLNCNSDTVYRYITDFINRSGEEECPVKNLYFWLKRVKQVPVRAYGAYRIGNPSLCCMLQRWIEEEIQYLEKSEQLRLHFTEFGPGNSEAIKKIFTNASVAELALYFRILIDMKLIRVDNNLDFFKAVTKIYRTKNAENISIDSLRNKFYNPEASTKKVMKEHVIMLLNYINSMS